MIPATVRITRAISGEAASFEMINNNKGIPTSASPNPNVNRESVAANRMHNTANVVNSGVIQSPSVTRSRDIFAGERTHRKLTPTGFHRTMDRMSLKQINTNQHIKVAALAVLSCMASWLAMQIVHELGHVMHVLASGATITKVVLSPLSISGTDVSPNPHPLFVVWGGPLWGCLLPLMFCLFARRIGWKHLHLVWFFAGFCLIANGAYLGMGVVNPVGDAKVLLELGTPRWLLGLFGVSAVGTGLWFWNGIGKRFGMGKSADDVDSREIVALCVLVVLIVVMELVLSSSV